MGEQLLKVRDLMARLRVSRATAYRIVARGQIDWTDVATGGRPSIRISEDALRKYVSGRTERGSAA